MERTLGSVYLSSMRKLHFALAPLLAISTLAAIGCGNAVFNDKGPAADAAPSDVASDGGSDSPVNGSDAGPTLLTNGGFEDPGDCKGWAGDHVTVTRDPLARTGQSSCRVCAADAHPITFAPQTKITGIKAGEKYTFSAWIHSAGAPVTNGLRAYAVEYDTTGAPVGSIYATTETDPIDAWSLSTVTIEIDPGGATLITYLDGPEVWPAGECFLVDDASVTLL